MNPSEYSYIPHSQEESNTRTQRSTLYDPSTYESNPAGTGVSPSIYGTERGQEQVATAYDQANTNNNNYFYDSTQLASSNSASENTTMYNVGNAYAESENKTDDFSKPYNNSELSAMSYNNSQVSTLPYYRPEGSYAPYNNSGASTSTYSSPEAYVSKSQYDQQSPNYESADVSRLTGPPLNDDARNSAYSSYGQNAGASSFYNSEQDAQNPTNSVKGTSEFNVSQENTTENTTDYYSNSAQLNDEQSADYTSLDQTQTSSSDPTPYQAYSPYSYPSPSPAPYPSPYPAPSYAPYPTPYPAYAPYSYPSPAPYSPYSAPSSTSAPAPVKESKNSK